MHHRASEEGSRVREGTGREGSASGGVRAPGTVLAEEVEPPAVDAAAASGDAGRQDVVQQLLEARDALGRHARDRADRSQAPEGLPRTAARAARRVDRAEGRRRRGRDRDAFEPPAIVPGGHRDAVSGVRRWHRQATQVDPAEPDGRRGGARGVDPVPNEVERHVRPRAEPDAGDTARAVRDVDRGQQQADARFAHAGLADVPAGAAVEPVGLRIGLAAVGRVPVAAAEPRVAASEAAGARRAGGRRVGRRRAGEAAAVAVRHARARVDADASAARLARRAGRRARVDGAGVGRTRVRHSDVRGTGVGLASVGETDVRRSGVEARVDGRRAGIDRNIRASIDHAARIGRTRVGQSDVRHPGVGWCHDVEREDHPRVARVRGIRRVARVGDIIRLVARDICRVDAHAVIVRRGIRPIGRDEGSVGGITRFRVLNGTAIAGDAERGALGRNLTEVHRRATA